MTVMKTIVTAFAVLAVACGSERRTPPSEPPAISPWDLWTPTPTPESTTTWTPAPTRAPAAIWTPNKPASDAILHAVAHANKL